MFVKIFASANSVPQCALKEPGARTITIATIFFGTPLLGEEYVF